jgi:hypothetical protein
VNYGGLNTVKPRFSKIKASKYLKIEEKAEIAKPLKN